MIEKGYYYVDKTLLVRDLLAQKGKITLFTRPRCFGKTLAQSMLKTFFEKEILDDGIVADNSIYFQGKKIMEAERYHIIKKYGVCFCKKSCKVIVG